MLLEVLMPLLGGVFLQYLIPFYNYIEFRFCIDMTSVLGFLEV